MARPTVLDPIKRHEICALLACGASRREAAAYVGCAPATITHTARRDPDFADRIARSEVHFELRHLRALNRAAVHSWRASAWALEHLRPEDYGRPVRMRGLAAPDDLRPRRRIGASNLAGVIEHNPPICSGRAQSMPDRCGRPPLRKGDLNRMATGNAGNCGEFTRDDAFLALRQAIVVSQLDPRQRDELLFHYALCSDPSIAAMFDHAPARPAEAESVVAQSGPSSRDGDQYHAAAGDSGGFSPDDAFAALQQAVVAAGLDHVLQDRILLSYSVISDPGLLAIFEHAPPICSGGSELTPASGLR